MTTHPVHFRVEPAERMQRIQVAIRLVLLIALGAIGCSSLYWFLYLALPALAALLISQHEPGHYLDEDAPRILRVLRWVAGAYAYLWLLTDTVPQGERGGPVELEIEPGGAPTTGSALLRLLYSVPAVLLLAVLSLVAALFWLVGAVFILVRQQLPAAIADYLALTLRYQFRLAAYHLSLVDSYPSLEQEHSASDVPHSGAI